MRANTNRFQQVGAPSVMESGQMNPMTYLLKIALPVLTGLLVVFTEARAEDWRTVWKDDMQELRVDRGSVRVNGSEIEYWYSDTVDAIVDWMEHRYYAVSDCANHQMRLVEVYDRASGETHPVQESGWKDMPYHPDDPVTVMHYEVCRDYGG